jgi:arylsulfatase A-like enzyme
MSVWNFMRSHFWIPVLFGILSGGHSVCCQCEAATQPNVLFIAIDDLRTELGCYGHDYVASANLDQLATEGTLFTRHYVQVATCGASRYALLTGRSPANSGAFTNVAMYNGKTALNPEEQPGAQSMPELFRRSGYHTTLIGKISHTADGRVYAYDGTGDGRDEIPHAWSEKATPLGSWKRGWGIFFAYENGHHREDGNGHKDLMQFTAENDDDLPDGMMATAAIEKLQQFSESEKPFFLGLGFFKPHLPFVATRQDWEYFSERDVPAPDHPQVIDSPHWHRSGEFYKYNSPLNKTRPLATHDAVAARKAYLACVRYTDRQVGRVLQALQKNGLADNTIVVVWGDHGWHLGETALWGKHTPFERANHSTLIIRAPGVSRAGIPCDALVESIDIYPTLVDLCQPSFTQMSHAVDGVSMRALLDGSRSEIKPVATSFWKRSISVRNTTHRLIVNYDNSGRVIGKELYDVTTSPDPIKNLVETHPAVVDQLSSYFPNANGD